MDEQRAGLTAALDADWGGGVYGILLDADEIRTGDPVAIEEAVGAISARPGSVRRA